MQRPRPRSRQIRGGGDKTGASSRIGPQTHEGACESTAKVARRYLACNRQVHGLSNAPILATFGHEILDVALESAPPAMERLRELRDRQLSQATGAVTLHGCLPRARRTADVVL